MRLSSRLSPNKNADWSLSVENSFELEDRLYELKDQKFLTKRIFLRVSENMHYEIFKYLNSKELLEIRGTKLGGYQLISNNILRSRIQNYYIRDPDLQFCDLYKIQSYPRKIGVMLEQMGEKNKLNLKNMNIHKYVECTTLMNILRYLPDLNILNIGNYN